MEEYSFNWGGIKLETPVINSIEETPIQKRILTPKSLKKIAFILISLLFTIINLSVLSYMVTMKEVLSNLVMEQEKQISMLWAASFMSEGIVTDELVIQKAHFYRTGKGLTIDIRPQPSFAKHFKGQGRFNVSDRELKSILLTLVDKMKEHLNEGSSLPEFDNLTIYISQNNYEVATYENGSLKLKGE